MSLGSLEAPPKRRDGGARAYCPACEAEYVDPALRCDDCDLPLRAFGS